MGWDSQRPWARQPFDTDMGWTLFSDYLMLPVPRRLSKLREFLPRYELERMAKECYWPERAALWDEHLADIRTTTIERVTEETAAEVAKRQLTLTRTMQSLAGKEFAAIARTYRGEDMPGNLSARDAIRLANYGIRLERVIMGEVTDRVEVGPDLSALSVEQLRTLRELQTKAGVR